MDPMHATVIPQPDAANYLPAQPVAGDLNEQLLGTDFWTDEMVAAAGIPIIDVPFVTVGGGIGSFVTVDYLRIGGVRPEQIRVLSALDQPWQTYEYLTRVSQIPRGERMRSDSASRPDNIWGFPSYGFVEGFKNPKIWWQVLTEPIFADYYTPHAGRAFAGMEREADRIGYATCWPRAWSGWSAGATAAATSPSSRRPRASPGPSGWPSAPASCTSRSATRG